jgi:hypothetical protein
MSALSQELDRYLNIRRSLGLDNSELITLAVNEPHAKHEAISAQSPYEGGAPLPLNNPLGIYRKHCQG